jgi:hypothetical protein
MKKPVYTIIILLMLGAFSSCNESPGVEPDVPKNFCGVPPDMMIQLIRNYKSQVWQKTSDTAAGKYDARFMEISIEQMENFIAYAKQSAKKDSLKVTSIRIYYINYPGEKKTEAYLAEHRTGNVFEDYSGCHSLALVPVVGNSMRDPERTDYYKLGMTAAAAPDPADFTSGRRTSATIFVPDNCSSSSNMENHNELCPPFRGCEHKTLIELADR